MDVKTTSALLGGIAIGCAATYCMQRYCYGLPNSSTHDCKVLQQPAASVIVPNITMDEVLSDDILREQFTRNIQFFGEDAQLRLAKSFVVVVGLGGVGSHAAHMLLRAGVGKLRLIDFDQVTLSSLNRHAVATRADVGLPKADCLKAHFKQIVPEANVEACIAMYTDERDDQLLSGSPDYVVDAIDNIDTKVSLLASCRRRGIRVVCVAGAGAKADPTRIRISDISQSTVDPLARTVRHRLKRDHDIQGGIPVVLSTEKPRCTLLPPDDVAAGGNLLDYQIVPNFRVCTIPVLGTSPAIFGMAAASHIICELCGLPLLPEPIFVLKEGAISAQLARLVDREEVRWGSAEDVQVDEAEVSYVVRELWQGRSARAAFTGKLPKDKGLSRNIVDLTLTRWNPRRPACVDNLVLLTCDEADEHDKIDIQCLRDAQPEWVLFVERRLAMSSAYFGTRKQ